MKRLVFSLLAASALVCSTAPAHANTAEQEHPLQQQWAFDGMFGRFDKPAIQRGYQVYKEVCSGCHLMKFKYFRDLTGAGFSADEVKALAASFQIKDGPDESGDMFDRPGRPSDHFPAPFPNEKAARAANGGAYPVDLSLVVKARHDGANYIYSLLTGYKEPPVGFEMAEGKHYNPYYPGRQIAMPAPLTTDGQVTYQDDTNATVDQMAKDVVNFLQWAAEPEMEVRKQTGIKVMMFMAAFTVLFYLAKCRIWSRIK